MIKGMPTMTEYLDGKRAEPADRISRADAIEAVRKHFKKYFPYALEYGEMLCETLSALPSAELTLQTPQTYGKSINPSNAEVVEDYISRADAICEVLVNDGIDNIVDRINALPSAEAEKKKAELKENGDWDCPDVYCDGCDHHRSVEWCSLAIPSHEEKIDNTYMVNEAFFEGFDAAEKRYRFLIEYVEELDKKLAEAEWIPCSERLPEEREWVGTKSFGTTKSDTILMTFDVDGTRFVKPLSLQNGELSRADAKTMDAFYKGWKMLAWMPLPKPYREEVEE